MSRLRPEPPRPVLTAMLVCDVVIRDVGTRKASAIGITHTVALRRLAPGRDPLVVYAALTDGQGDYEVRIVLVGHEDLRARGTVARTHVVLHDRTSVGELTIELSALPVDRPGYFGLQFLANDGVLGGVSLAVVQSPDGGGGS